MVVAIDVFGSPSLQALLHNVIPDHTGSMEDVFMKTHRSPAHPLLVERLLGGLDNWDSEYFIFNAHTGYSKHEQTMAFFPLLPMAMWVLSKTLFLPLSLLMPQRSIMLIAGVFLNLMAFPVATVALYLLTFELSHDKRLSLLTAGLFSLNPASVFMSAVYSETLFALFTFSGLLALEKRQQWLASLCFSLATLTRSNGVVLCGFLGYQCLSRITETLFYQYYRTVGLRLQSCAKCVGITALQCMLTVAPFCGFQLYGYLLYCGRPPLPPTSLPAWCDYTFPLPYSFIQEHYWNVGFLRYYELKQLPNFLLASPMVVLVVLCAWRYFTGGGIFVAPRKTGAGKGRHRTSRGNWDGQSQDSSTDATQDQSHDSKMERDKMLPEQGVQGKGVCSLGDLCSTSLLRPYVFHLLILTVFAVFNMHIQVS